MKNTVFLFFVLVLSSCNSLLLRMNGMRNPEKPVALEEVISFAQSIGIDTSRILFWTSSDAKAKFWRKFNYIPDLYVFDSNGNWLPYRDNAACNAAGFSLAKEFCNYTFSSPDSSEQVEYYLSNLRKSDSSVVTSILPPGKSYTILIAWGRFLGPVAKEHLPKWQEDLLQNTDCVFQHYFVCFDRIKRQQ